MQAASTRSHPDTYSRIFLSDGLSSPSTRLTLLSEYQKVKPTLSRLWRNQTGTRFALDAFQLLALPLLLTLHAFVELPDLADASHQLHRHKEFTEDIPYMNKQGYYFPARSLSDLLQLIILPMRLPSVSMTSLMFSSVAPSHSF